ncbi:hypothetical protein Tco_1165639 [Tanacetum coccineum]
METQRSGPPNVRMMYTGLFSKPHGKNSLLMRKKGKREKTLCLMAVPKISRSHLTISSKEKLEKGYDRFQTTPITMGCLGAGVSVEDANHKFEPKPLPAKHKQVTAQEFIVLIHFLSKATTMLLPGLADEIKKFYKRGQAEGQEKCKFKGSKEGNRQEAGKGQNFKPVQIEKEALMTIDEGQINWVEQTTDEELNHALIAFTVNNKVFMCSKLCLDSYNALQAKYDELQSEFGNQEAVLVANKIAVKKLES